MIPTPQSTKSLPLRVDRLTPRESIEDHSESIEPTITAVTL